MNEGSNVAEGLEAVSLDEAFAAALSESGTAISDDGVIPMPGLTPEGQSDTDVTPAPAEHPAASEQLSPEQELSKLMLEDSDPVSGDTEDGAKPDDTPGITPGSDEFWNLGVEVETAEGSQTVTINELRDGFMQRADYTRKTQAVAAERKRLEKAEALMDELERDPVALTQKLMVQLNIGDEFDIQAADIPEVAKIRSPEELEKVIAEAVEQRVESDPRIKDAAMVRYMSDISSEFDRIQGIHDSVIPQELRDDLVQEAIRLGTSDLEYVFKARLARAQARQSRATERTSGAPRRPQGNQHAGSPPDSNDVIETLDDAWNAALREQAQTNI